MKKALIMLTASLAVCFAAQAAEYVTIGNPGNAVDYNSYGAVAYTYKVSKYEVTGAEFGAAIAADPRVGTSTPSSGSTPAANVSWYEAAKYCNWLTTGDAYNGAYQFDGSGTLTNVMTRDQIFSAGDLFYVLPTEDEWYKAAYFKSDASGYSVYANGTDTAPSQTDANYYGYYATWDVGSGTVEQNGTYDMNGNLMEWMETPWDGTFNYINESGVVRGGDYNHANNALGEIYLQSWNRQAYYQDDHYSWIGFRVAAVPEPATAGLLGIAGLVITGCRRIRKTYGF